MKCKHEHKDFCLCNQLDTTPNEECPIHGGGEKHPTCDKCGQYIKKWNV